MAGPPGVQLCLPRSELCLLACSVPGKTHCSRDTPPPQATSCPPGAGLADAARGPRNEAPGQLGCGLCCRFQRNVLDLSLQWRFANLPNNAKLEMVPASRSREGPKNTVGTAPALLVDCGLRGHKPQGAAPTQPPALGPAEPLSTLVAGMRLGSWCCGCCGGSRCCVHLTCKPGPCLTAWSCRGEYRAQ